MEHIETLNDALIECVKAAGGSKVVASLLWPEKPMQDAQRLLINCFNPDRSEKISPDQTLFILKLAKEHGYHIGLSFICSILGYSRPTPIEPEDEKAQLQKDFIDAVNRLDSIKSKLQTNGMLKAVA